MLDREEKPVYTLTISVSDLRNPARSSSASANIYLLDVNDSPPIFDASLLDKTVSIPEDTPTNTFITSVIATDSDLDADLTYEVVSVVTYDQDDNDITSTLDYRTIFSFDPTDGSITLISPVDREMTEKFVFTISAVDLNSQDVDARSSQNNGKYIIAFVILSAWLLKFWHSWCINVLLSVWEIWKQLQNVQKSYVIH